MTKKLEQYNKYIFVGGGIMAERLYPQMKATKMELVGVCDLLDDSVRKVNTFHEEMIQHASKLEELFANPEVAIVMAVNAFFVPEVLGELLKIYKDIKGRVFAANPYTCLRPCVMNDDFAAEVRIPLDDIRYKEVEAMFTDEESKKVFHLLYTGKTYDSATDSFELLAYEEMEQNYYFSEDYWMTFDFLNCTICETEATVYDCGAYIGDNIEGLCDVIPQKDIYYYAFEPEKNNANIIRSSDTFKACCKELQVLEYGVGNENKKLYFDFSEKQTDGGRFTDAVSENSQMLELRRLDDLCLNVHGQTYIKMDIEGSELDALKGAESIIKETRPFLAICVYHRKNDLIDIPLYIKSITEQYDFYLRGGFHTILWAIPKEL